MPWNQQSEKALERPIRPEDARHALHKAAGIAIALATVILAQYCRGKGLTSRQKVLFGLPADGNEKAAVPPRAAEAQHTPIGSLGPPLRPRRPLTPSGENRGVAKTPPTPGSDSSRRRTASPYSETHAVTTPEQLQQYLNYFESHSREASPSGGGGGDRTPPGTSQQFGSGDEAVHHYRPSLQARGKTGSPLRADSVLSPSNQETFEAVLARLQTDASTLETWIDRFRQWLAAEVVQPLLQNVRRAHLDVAECAAQLGLHRVELSNLSEAAGISSTRGLEADEEAQINMLRAQLQHQLQQPMQEQQRKAVLACLQAVKRYQNLTLLLRGEAPRNVVPPVPRGYIAFRLHALAKGSCLGEFTWNSGGSWQGKPWSADLLTDSALVFYLFAAYLEAPDWQFPLDERAATATTAPLYIGSLPTRPAHHCSALLPVRPAALPSRAAAVLALGLATKEPSFTLVLDGQPALTLKSYTAAFTQLLLLTRYNELQNFGMLGSNNLDFLKLKAVLQPEHGLYALAKTKWFALW